MLTQPAKLLLLLQHALQTPFQCRRQHKLIEAESRLRCFQQPSQFTLRAAKLHGVGRLRVRSRLWRAVRELLDLPRQIGVTLPCLVRGELERRSAESLFVAFYVASQDLDDLPGKGH
jgi:hypothetical protein